ncbi:MAG: hypothetical protein JNM22_06125 [Saprospiraceae bacterium]|jgi:hypothetical protein|nr:hypothetical protein [Saprospiraceae bacterium]
MKQLFVLSLLAVFFTATVCAQTGSSGIFRTAKDFKNGKIEYAIRCDSQSHKIKADPLFKRNRVIVKHEGKTYKIDKDSVYAIRYCSGVVQRLYQKKAYQMVNEGEDILLYKVATLPMGKGQPAETTWYFSKDATWSIQPLTLGNLLGAFPDNHAFHDAIIAEFKTDGELPKYDDMHKMMRINRLYENSKKQ